MSKTRYIVQSVLTVIFLGGVALGVNYLFQAVATGPQSTLSGDDAPYPPPGFTLPAPDPNLVMTLTVEAALPTNEPLPTPLPTPVVTRIPASHGPILTAAPGAVAGPSTFLFRTADRVRESSTDGSPERLVVDVQEQTSLYLATDMLGVGERQWGSASPDGERLALVLSTARTPPERGQAAPELSIHLFDRREGRMVKLVDDGISPAWSPDGRQIAFLRGPALWIVEPESGAIREIYSPDPQNEHYVSEMDWSPDGERIVLVDAVYRQSAQIKIVAVDGSAPARELVPPPFWVFAPRWSPDGLQILYVSTAGQSSSSEVFYNLWIVNADGSAPQQITRDINVFSEPRWSPDGNWIAFAGPIGYESPESNYDLWLVDRRESVLKRLTATDRINETAPIWSLDGLAIFYVTDRDQVRAISLMDGRQQSLPSVSRDFILIP